MTNRLYIKWLIHKRKVLSKIISRVGNNVLKLYEEGYNTPAKDYLYSVMILINNITVFYNLKVTIDDGTN